MASDTIFSLLQVSHLFSTPFFLLLSSVGESLVILKNLFSDLDKLLINLNKLSLRFIVY